MEIRLQDSIFHGLAGTGISFEHFCLEGNMTQLRFIKNALFIPCLERLLAMAVSVRSP